MKQHALALFGLCLDLLGRTAEFWTAREQPHADQSRCDIDYDRSIAVVSLVNIGVVALDYPVQGEPCGSRFGRRPRGPARIIASVG
jgi:hypothetical protein